MQACAQFKIQTQLRQGEIDTVCQCGSVDLGGAEGIEY